MCVSGSVPSLKLAMVIPQASLGKYHQNGRSSIAILAFQEVVLATTRLAVNGWAFPVVIPTGSMAQG